MSKIPVPSFLNGGKKGSPKTLAYDLKTFPRNEIDKGVVQMKQKRLDKERAKINWGPQEEQLPVWSAKEFHKRCQAELDKKEQGSRSYRTLIVIDGFALDVTDFLGDHPGGPAMLASEHGNDVTAKFKGSYYKHSNAARNMQSMYRVAKVQGQVVPLNGSDDDGNGSASE
jgi:stearoyl-CoA desaturase (Delta-9 desaturase)